MERQPAHWFVLFGNPATLPRWSWRRWLADGYRHCLAISDLPLGGSVTIEHAGTEMRLTQWASSAERVTLHYLERGDALHAYMVKPVATKARAALRPCMTCVETTKALVGIHAPHIITPLQLARHLVARGARDVAIRVPAFANA